MSDIPSSQSDYKFVTFSKANPLMKDFVFTGNVALPKPGDKLRIEPIAFITECAAARLMLLKGRWNVINMDGRITGPTNLLDFYASGKYLGLLETSSIIEGFKLSSKSEYDASNEVKNKIFTQVSKDTIEALYYEVYLKYGHNLPIYSSAFGKYLVDALKETEGFFEEINTLSGDYVYQEIRNVNGTITTSPESILSGEEILQDGYVIYAKRSLQVSSERISITEETVTGKIKVDIGLSDLLEGGLMSCGAIAICEVSNYIYSYDNESSTETEILDTNTWVAIPLFDNVDIDSKIIETNIDVNDIATKAINVSGGVPPQQNANALGRLSVGLRSIVSWRRLKYTANIDEVL